VQLFASILRREEDGDYYLVTPVEKWRIKVQRHPLLVTDVQACEQPAGRDVLYATLNTGKTVPISGEHPLFTTPGERDIPALQLDHGLSAQLTRPVWYRLAEMALAAGDKPVLYSGDYRFTLAEAG
jgi:hypothetical protein